MDINFIQHSLPDHRFIH